MIMAIAGHVSRDMLSRYARIRTEAKRKALEAISTRTLDVPAAKKAASPKCHILRDPTPKSVTYVSGMKCYLCVRNGPRKGGRGERIRTSDLTVPN